MPRGLIGRGSEIAQAESTAFIHNTEAVCSPVTVRVLSGGGYMYVAYAPHVVMQCSHAADAWRCAYLCQFQRLGVSVFPLDFFSFLLSLNPGYSTDYGKGNAITWSLYDGPYET